MVGLSLLKLATDIFFADPKQLGYSVFELGIIMLLVCAISSLAES